MYGKRFCWWVGRGLFFVLGGLATPFWRFGAFINYKLNYFLKKHGLTRPDNWILQRRNLQVVIFLALLLVALPQTVLSKRQDSYAVGRNTIAYVLSAPSEDYELEEIKAEPPAAEQVAPSWKEGVVSTDIYAVPQRQRYPMEQDLAAVAPGGLAINKPYIMPGAVIGGMRNKTVEYVVEPGDSLSTIAYQFDVSVVTVLWANNLTLQSVIRPGNKLKIPPTSGIMHKIKKGDNLKKIATLYRAKMDDIVRFNKLKEDGTDLIIGEEIMIPGGAKPYVYVPPVRPTIGSIAAPAGSRQAAGAYGFVWPTTARNVTQYYNWRHHAIDIAGSMATAIYAAKAGTVEVSQCGWNGGYGCYIILNHGDGYKTVYGHNSRLLVSVGERVDIGQAIALMGNTGNVRGRTGIHLHFEIRINGTLVNPLGYVK